MICKVKYFKPQSGGYAGAAYTFRTNLPFLKVGDKVLAPAGNEEPKRAIVVEVNCPESDIKLEWADRVKWITQFDEEERQA